MDWLAAASVIADVSGRPVFALDQSGRIQLFNVGMEHLLCWPRREILGRHWRDMCATPVDAEHTDWWLNQALRGAVRECDCPAAMRDGQRLTLGLEVSPVGQGVDSGVVAIVQTHQTLSEPANGVPFADDQHYEITAFAGEFGTILNQFSRLPREVSLTGQTCHLALHSSPEPCAGCPARQLTPTSGSATAVLARDDGRALYDVVTAEPASESSAFVKVRSISNELLSGLLLAKVGHLARQCGLSDRQREILDLLLLGRSADEIARILKISARTVKFHQTNVLDKLGADSRIDLLRLIM